MAKKKTRKTSKAGKPLGRPPKAPDASRGHFLQVRIQEVEKDTFAAAADLSGLDVSAWVRTTLRAAARRQITDSGGNVPFLGGK